jgi:hypothetical protein
MASSATETRQQLWWLLCSADLNNADLSGTDLSGLTLMSADLIPHQPARRRICGMWSWGCQKSRSSDLLRLLSGLVREVAAVGWPMLAILLSVGALLGAELLLAAVWLMLIFTAAMGSLSVAVVVLIWPLWVYDVRHQQLSRARWDEHTRLPAGISAERLRHLG